MPKVVKYSKGSIVYFEGDIDDRIFILQKGFVNSKVKDVETNNYVNSAVQSGEFFGVKSAIGHFPREETITALSDCLCVVLDQKEFEALAGSNKELMMKMMRIFTKQLRVVHQKIGHLLADHSPASANEKLFSVAKAFYDDEDYLTCFEVLVKYFISYPALKQNSKFIEMYKMSKLSYEKKARREANRHRDDDGFGDGAEATGNDIFSLPMFQRFMKIYNKGEVIVAEQDVGNTFYFIEGGTVALFKCANGKNKSLGFLKPGEFFGEMALLDKSPRTATCIAKTVVKVLEFNKVNFELLITGNPKIACNLLKILAKRIFAQTRSLEILTVKNPFDRIVGAIVIYNELYPSAVGPGDKIEIKQSPTELAYWAGLPVDETREVLNRLVAMRKISVFDDFIVINNINDLKRTFEKRNNNQ